MRNWQKIFCFIACLAVHASYASHAATRIVSLAPDLTETLFAIGAGNYIVGAMQGSDFPTQAKLIPRVGTYSGIDLETIIAMHPDLIVTWEGNFATQLNVFKQVGIPIYVSHPTYLEDIPEGMQKLGLLTGRQALAQAAANTFTKTLTALKQKYQTRKKVRVFYQIGEYSLYTVNRHSWINQAITVCGGENVFANAPLVSGEVSWEAVLAANPDVIISDAVNPAWQQRWLKWTNVSAVKNHYLFTLNPDLIERASPRLLEGVTRLCAQLQRVREA